MLNELLSENLKIQLLNTEDAVAVQLYPTSTNFIDVSGYERFAFLISAGALTTALTFQVQQATAANGTPKDITGATVTVGATGDDKWYLIEVMTSALDINNDYRYVTLNATGASGGDDYAAIHFIAWNAGIKPVTQGSDKGSIVSVLG
jgi:hypothetical protein